MKTDNKIFSFFISLALLFWNPLSFYLIYKNTPAYQFNSIHLFYWIIFLSGILIIFLTYKNWLSDKIKNLLLLLVFTGSTFSFIVLIDMSIGMVMGNNSEDPINEGLIFEPKSRVIHKTVEFNYVADINSLGLRDREINIEKDKKLRILCFGDSVTYGWGVNIENSWPKKLEKYLIENGFDNIEVINCGQPGQYTTTYKLNMEKVIPLLKPDIVLLGVLQADDLAQLYESNFLNNKKSNSKTLQLALVKYLKHSFLHLINLMKSSNPKEINIQYNWKESTTALMEKFGHLQKLTFNNLDDSVKRLFQTGNLNPGLLNYYIYYPNSNLVINNPDHPSTHIAISLMNKDIAEIKMLCENNDSQLIFINIPINKYTGHQVIRGPTDILSSYFLTNNHIDSIYKQVAENNLLPYFEMTDHFISLQDKTGYFFHYDGHPNEKGYEEIANYIGEKLLEEKYLKNYN